MLVLAAAATVLPARTAWAVALRVGPGAALIQGIVPGKPAELDLPITLWNKDDRPHDVVLSVLRPSREAMAMPSGYVDIPDPSWISFSASEITVPAGGQAAVRMKIAVPAGDAYLNQHWSMALAVRTKPAQGQMVAIGLYPRFEIETASAPVAGSLLRRARPPFGDLVATPAIASVERLVPGAGPRRVSLTVWNNTDKPWTGEVSLVASAESAKKERLSLSGGWEWLQDPRWVKLGSPSLAIGPRGRAELALDVDVPAGVKGTAWEAIVLLKSRTGPLAGSRCPATLARLRLGSGSLKAGPQDGQGRGP